MFYSEFDDNRAVLVCRFARGGDEANDFGPLIERLGSAAVATKGRDVRLALLIIIDPGHPLPNSAWRKRIAEATGTASFRPFFAVVTNNPLARGMLTALSWLRPQRFEAYVTDVDTKAMAWLESKREEPLPELRAMYVRVTRMGQGSGTGQPTAGAS